MGEPAKTLDGILLSDPVQACIPALSALRRELHVIPELAGEETKTQQLIQRELDRAGLEHSEVAGTGVTTAIGGHEPGPILLIRADMDALPVSEETGLPFSSRHPGRMHACGHDAHMAMALTAARLLAAAPPKRGVIKFLFQPAEERGAGAARSIQDGILTDPDVTHALAFHVWSPLAVGRVAAARGPALASVDSFALTVVGRATHAARPEQGTDPIPIAAQVISAAQSLISRRIAPHHRAVLSFTAIEGGSTYNVVPDRVRILGTIRTFDQGIRDFLVDELQHLAASTASALGATTEWESYEQLPPVVNDPAFADRCARVAAGVVGGDSVVSEDPLMVGEDFGLILNAVPGAMVLLGCGDPDGGQPVPHHHPKFDLDERVLAIGVELALKIAADVLQSEST